MKKTENLRKQREALIKKWTAIRDRAWRGRSVKERVAFERFEERLRKNGLSESEILYRWLLRERVRKPLAKWAADLYQKCEEEAEVAYLKGFMRSKTSKLSSRSLMP